MDPNKVFIDVISTCLGDWDENGLNWNMDSINQFIEKYEGLFLTSSGLFVKGLRAKVGNVQPHQTMDGVLGIVSLNVFVLRNRLAHLRPTQNN